MNQLAIITDQISQDLEEALVIIKKQGYYYIELHNVFNKSIEEVSDEELKIIQGLINKYDMEVVNIASTVFFLCPLYDNYQVSLFNEEFHAIKGDYQEHLKYLKRAIKVAKALDCNSVRIFPFRYPDNPKQKIVGTSDDLIQIAKYLNEAVKIAEKENITLLLENCPYSHCPKGAMTLKVKKLVNNNYLKLLWDPANSYRAEKNQVPKEYLDLNLEEEYELIKNDLGYMHLKNYHYDMTQTKPFVHESLLKGDINYQELLGKVVKEYQGVLSLEAEVASKECIESMHDLKQLIKEGNN